MNEAKTTDNELATIDAKELSLVEENSLNAQQLAILLKKTPKKYTKTRPGKGGGDWTFVTGGYMKKMLNLMFGWDWDFEIVDQNIYLESKEVVVKGKLTCRSGGNTIVKMQFGNKDIVFKKLRQGETGERQPLSIGNDFKAAATDCLKKCASELGIAADIYNKEEFREVLVELEESECTIELLEKLYNEKGQTLSEDDQLNVERIIETKEQSSYKKAITILKNAK